jgi:hypothetical protein
VFFNYKIEGSIMNFTNSCQNERGSVLVIGLVFLVLLALLGNTAVIVTTMDMKIGTSHRESTEALIDADAGVNYAIAQIETEFKAGTLSFPTTIGGTSNLTSSSFTPAPTGFKFVYNPTTLTKTGENRYEFTTVGTSTNNTNPSTATIVVTCQQRSAITMAAFGDEKLELKNNAVVKSFKSNSSNSSKNDPDHISYASTHEGDVGSNEELLAHSGSDIDGRGVLGEDTSGNDAWNRIADPDDFYDQAPVEEENIDFDPLGMFPGANFPPASRPDLRIDPPYFASGNNDNCPAAGGNCVDIVGDACTDLCDNERIYLRSAGTDDHMKLIAGDYYLTGSKAFDMAGNTTLTIDVTAGGEVRLFVDGETISVGAANINILGGTAANFSIYANTSSGLTFGNSSDFTAFIYAPKGDIDINNSGRFTGAVWGSQVDVKNSANFYYDSALADKYLSKDIEIVTWQDFRN